MARRVVALRTVHNASLSLDDALDRPPWLGRGPNYTMRTVTGAERSRWELQAKRVLRNGRKIDCPIGRPSPSDCEGTDAIERLFWGRQRGYCLELGALDGVRASETRRFQQAVGCRRILIDANPNWRARRRAMAADAVGVTAAVCTARRTLHYLQHVTQPPVSGIAEFMSPRFVEHWYPEVASALRTSNASGVAALGVGGLARALAPAGRVRVLPLACLRLSAILDAVGVAHVDFAIVDVEGAELSVLRRRTAHASATPHRIPARSLLTAPLKALWYCLVCAAQVLRSVDWQVPTIPFWPQTLPYRPLASPSRCVILCSIDWQRVSFGVLVVEAISDKRPRDFDARVVELVRRKSHGAGHGPYRGLLARALIHTCPCVMCIHRCTGGRTARTACCGARGATSGWRTSTSGRGRDRDGGGDE